ncbi:MAG TPA: PAS domain S-box protein, partial [Spirochaetota bacterium]|nr:PAS domain S-box protein [Spirochaetota bacterium]
MSLHENESDKKDSLRNKVLGLGERSIKKNYYSELQSGIEELKRFRNLLDKVNDGILIVRIRDGEIIDANSIAKMIFFGEVGFENIQKKKKLQDVIGEKSYEELSYFFTNKKDSDIDDKKNIFRKEIVVGSNRFEFSASENNYDGEFFFTSIFHDITERVKAESALKESEKYLKTVLDSLSDAVFIHDFENYRIIDVNKRMLEMYGYTREEALQKTVEDISAAKESFDQKKAISRLENAKLNGGETFEWLAKRKDDSIFWTEVSVRLVEFGEKKYLLALVRDISERKKEQEEKIKFEQQLLHTQKLESLGILAGGIAHDFNNILTAVLGYTELAILQIDDSSSTLNFLKEIK